MPSVKIFGEGPLGADQVMRSPYGWDPCPEERASREFPSRFGRLKAQGEAGRL